MITKSAGIIPNLGHGLVFDLTLVEIEVRRSLENIAARQSRECSGFSLRTRLTKSCATRHASFAGIEFVICRHRIDLRVSIVCMKNGDQRIAATAAAVGAASDPDRCSGKMAGQAHE